MLVPTVLTDVDRGHEGLLARGVRPGCGVQRLRTLDDALDLANDTRYGLQAAIFTSDLASALRPPTRSTSAASLVNEVPTFRTDQMPYGGLRDSGNTREGPRYAVREMTEERLVVIQL